MTTFNSILAYPYSLQGVTATNDIRLVGTLGTAACEIYSEPPIELQQLAEYQHGIATRIADARKNPLFAWMVLET